jgi:LmbE family N-acetylglucosaminyl deacetylase
MVELYWFEVEERIREMREAAAKLKLYAYIMYSTNPRKQEALDRMRRAVEEIIECIEILAEKTT